MRLEPVHWLMPVAVLLALAGLSWSQYLIHGLEADEPGEGASQAERDAYLEAYTHATAPARWAVYPAAAIAVFALGALAWQWKRPERLPRLWHSDRAMTLIGTGAIVLCAILSLLHAHADGRWHAVDHIVPPVWFVMLGAVSYLGFGIGLAVTWRFFGQPAEPTGLQRLTGALVGATVGSVGVAGAIIGIDPSASDAMIVLGPVIGGILILAIASAALASRLSALGAPLRRDGDHPSHNP